MAFTALLSTLPPLFAPLKLFLDLADKYEANACAFVGMLHR